jgi:hypothetical protein
MQKDLIFFKTMQHPWFKLQFNLENMSILLSSSNGNSKKTLEPLIQRLYNLTL